MLRFTTSDGCEIAYRLRTRPAPGADRQSLLATSMTNVAQVLVLLGGSGSVFLMFVAVSVIGAPAATRMIEMRNRSLEKIAP
jgi:hypothetical protein